MRKHGDMNFELIGHTDSRNTAAYNLALSKRRGEAVKSYLIASGVDSTILQIVPKGKSDRRIKDEKNAVHQSENRIVEISVDSLPREVELVSQFADLQVERKDLRSGVKNLDFLMNAEGNVVTDRLYFSSNRTNLTDFSRLSLDLIASVLENNEEVDVVLYGFDYTSKKMAQTRAKNITTYLESKGLDPNRFSFEFKIGTSEDEAQLGNYDVRNAIFFSYIPPDNLNIVSKTEEFRKFLNVGEVPSEVKRLVEIQKNRNDVKVIHKKITPNKYVAKAVHFASNSAALDHRTEAVLSRLAMFMKANPMATVILNPISGNEVTNSNSVILKRAESIRAYLAEFGISSERISVEVEVRQLDSSAGEFERAMIRRVEFILQNVPAIEYIEQVFDVKSNAKPDRDVLNKLFSDKNNSSTSSLGSGRK
jgi:outer membrane protein OmpA-like peptidoglycan-associated protein